MLKTSCNNNSTSKTKQSVQDLNSCIAKKAYELWEKRGKQQGKDTEYWLEAEKQVRESAARLSFAVKPASSMAATIKKINKRNSKSR